MDLKGAYKPLSLRWGVDKYWGIETDWNDYSVFIRPLNVVCVVYRVLCVCPPTHTTYNGPMNTLQPLQSVSMSAQHSAVMIAYMLLLGPSSTASGHPISLRGHDEQ